MDIGTQVSLVGLRERVLILILILIIIIIIIQTHVLLSNSACLDVLIAKKQLQQAVQGKMILIRVVSMLVGLICSTSPSRVYEESSGYHTQRTESVDYDYDWD